MSSDADVKQTSRPETSDEGPVYIPQFGRYRNLEYLGAGGMAKVYKAFDPTLGRTIALKFIRKGIPLVGERLLMEARSQARIEHEHVCKVYEVGEVVEEGPFGKCSYIAMQYIQGKTLRDIMTSLTLEQKVKLMKEVAEALHAAHRMGLIHRDMKPSNVMVEQREDGVWVPFVMDFGLAREVRAPGLTETGMVLGSPFYMSPEQARGEVHQLDRRSDIYSIGVTLYEVLTGKFPFDGDTTIDAMIQLLQEEPVPLRKRVSSIPKDLETIVLKCLDKEPDSRYDSARALAADLGRYLDGEPITATPPALVYRIRKRLKKHRAVAVISFLALVLILVFGGIGQQARANARKQAELAHRFGQQVKEIEGILRASYMLPLHDTGKEKQIVRSRMGRMEEEIRQAGKIALGPGYHALGRGCLALQEYGKAREHLERAWHEGYRLPEVAYALGLTMGALFQKEMRESERIRSRELRESVQKRIEKEYRDPALLYLRLGRDSGEESAGYAGALMDFYEKKWDTAITKLHAVGSQTPWFHEVWSISGDIYTTMAQDKKRNGEYEAARDDVLAAEKSYQTAIETARSDPRGYLGMCELGTVMIELHMERGFFSPNAYSDSLQFCRNALKADPRNPHAYTKESYIHALWSERQLYSGESPDPASEESIRTAAEALKMEPQDAAPYRTMGYALLNRSEYQLNHGQDPRGTLNQAVDSYRKAIEIGPQRDVAYNNMGIAYGILGMYEMSQGLDPRNSHDLAVESFREAIRMNPSNSSAYNNIGSAYHFNARFEMEHGQNPLPTLARAIASYRRSIHFNPNRVTVIGNMGLAHLHSAEYKILTGLDPVDSLLQADKELDGALEKNAHHVDACIYYARVRILSAHRKMQDAQSPEADLVQAERMIDRALNVNPASTDAYVAKGKLETAHFRFAVQEYRNPTKHYVNGDSAYAKALKLRSQNLDAYGGQLELICSQVEWLFDENRPAGKEIEQGLSVAERALAAHPEAARILAHRGVLYLMAARIASGPQPRAEAVEKAEQSLQRAIQLNSNLRHRLEPYLQEARKR